MITKNRTGKFGFLKYSAGIVVALAITILFACEKKTKIEEPVIIDEQVKPKAELIQEETTSTDQNEQVFIIVEQPATFKNDKGDEGDLNEFRNWVNKNLVYPAAAAEKGIQGKLYIQFTVSKRGSVFDVKVIRGVDPILDQEAIRVIKSSPLWTPAMQSGKNVAQQFVIPVNFVLQ